MSTMSEHNIKDSEWWVFTYSYQKNKASTAPPKGDDEN